MKRLLFFAMVLVIAVAVLAAGCTGSGNAPAQPSGSSGSSGSGSSQQTASGFSLTPTAVDKVPDNLGMACDASKDPITAKITVISRGGKGLYMCKSLDVTAYMSTGEILKDTIKPDVNTEKQFDGTKGVDRIVVVANYNNGDSYKIYDDVLEYKKRSNNQ